MSRRAGRPAPPARRLGGRLVLLLAMALCIGIEAALWSADRGWIGSPSWRVLATVLAGLRNDLLNGQEALYPGQRATMFVTYAFVHTGPVHLLGNMLALGWLWLRGLPHVAGASGMATLWLASGAGAGIAFALLADPASVTVGASGCVFGLFGAWTAPHLRERPDLLRIVLIVLLLLGIDLLSPLLYGSARAWQAHLGGFLAGAVLGLLLAPFRLRRREH